jgi:hypothetical protein
MNATTAFLCIITLCLVSISVPAGPQTTLASRSDRDSAPSRGQETEKPATIQKANPNGMSGGMPSAGKPKQMPTPPDRSQIVEERLRSGQMEKPIAQGEVSDRLNQMYSGSNSPVQ